MLLWFARSKANKTIKFLYLDLQNFYVIQKSQLITSNNEEDTLMEAGLNKSDEK